MTDSAGDSLALGELRVLLLDCQTTGATPSRGHLLEIGWAQWRAAEGVLAPRAIESRLVRLPRGASLPAPIVRLTGITPGAMAQAIPRAEVWRALGAAIARLAGADPTGTPQPILGVAHVARFERRFLESLHFACAPGESFPLELLCTHEIARRLLPDLPRRGLRALAGYFGSPLPELKRAGSHVAATATVWAGLVARLEREHGVRTLGALQALLAQAPPRRGRWAYPLPRERRLALPARPGVYRFLDGRGAVLYVGKARSLHHRVNSYYRKRRAGEKTLELVSQVRDLQTTATASALEAALLEASEIRRLDPPYNRALRDRGQEVWFFTPDFDCARPQPDASHPRGPYPGRAPFESLASLARLCARGPRALRGETAAAVALGVIDPARLARGALRAGRRAFLERHGEAAGPGEAEDVTSTTGLLALGTRLWRERVAASKEAEVRAEAHEEGTVAPRLLDGEQVAGMLEGIALGAAHLERRARWLVLLSEASLCWPAAAGPLEPRGAPERHLLILEGGEVRAVGTVPDTSPVPPPPGAGRRRLTRQANFDRATYDRLRVLTTELRRLVAEERELLVLLGTHRRLDTPRLQRLLMMV